MYIDGLAERGRFIESHTTRFATKLQSADIGVTVVQPAKGGKYSAIKIKRLESVIQNSDWIQLLRKVIEPIRKEIFGVHEVEKSAMSDLSTDRSSLSYMKLRFSITYLCHGKPDAREIPLPLDTICQHIILSTNKYALTSQAPTSIRHSNNKECPRIQHLTIKLYSVIRSRSLIQLFFERGIVLSYPTIRTFINDLSQTVKVLYSDSDNKVLPSALRMGLFTIFVDDNLDKNSSSVNAKAHFHGTGVSVLQYPTTDNPGLIRLRKKFGE